MTRVYAINLDTCTDCPCYYRTNAISPGRSNHYCGFADDRLLNRTINGDLAEPIPEWCPLPEATKEEVTPIVNCHQCAHIHLAATVNWGVLEARCLYHNARPISIVRAAVAITPPDWCPLSKATNTEVTT